jgi:putative serine/threonine protein kinase
MLREARLLNKANTVQVGPQLLGATRNFLVMQFIEGTFLPQWLEKRVGKTQLRMILRELLEQCWRLDEAGLDHGELSHAPKHIIIDPKNRAVIVDFETSSAKRKPSNVTSMSQFLFMSEISRTIRRELSIKDTENIVSSLRVYKHDMSRKNFLQILKSCGL